MVGRVVDEKPQHISVKPLGPVTLLARGAGWAQVLERRRYGTRIVVQENREDLADARYLGSHVPFGARPDVAVDAGHSGVGGLAVRRILRLHDDVTDAGAEIVGLHERGRAPRGDRHEQQDEKGDNAEYGHLDLLSGLVEVDDRERAHERVPVAFQYDAE